MSCICCDGMVGQKYLSHSTHLEKKRRRARRGATRGGGEMEGERGWGREENISILHVNNNEYFFLNLP